MIAIDLSALKPAEERRENESPYVYGETFKEWAERVPDAVQAYILPASAVPAGLLPSDVGIDYKTALRCASSYEGKTPNAIIHNGEALANAGDWLLVYGSPY